MADSPVLIVLEALLAAPAVTAIVGDRIHAEIAPQGTPMPSVTVRLSGGSEDYALDGPAGLIEARVVVTALAGTFRQADELAGTIGDVLRSYRDNRVTAFRDGTDVSDYVEALAAFRRATEVHLVVSR